MLTTLKRISFENFIKDDQGVVRGIGSPIYYDYDLDNEALEPLAAHIKKSAIDLIETINLLHLKESKNFLMN